MNTLYIYFTSSFAILTPSTNAFHSPQADFTDALRPLHRLKRLRLPFRPTGLHWSQSHAITDEDVHPQERLLIMSVAKELSTSLHTISLYRRFERPPRIRHPFRPSNTSYYIGWCDYHIVRRDGNVVNAWPEWPRSQEETREKTHWLHDYH